MHQLLGVLQHVLRLHDIKQTQKIDKRRVSDTHEREIKVIPSFSISLPLLEQLIKENHQWHCEQFIQISIASPLKDPIIFDNLFQIFPSLTILF